MQLYFFGFNDCIEWRRAGPMPARPVRPPFDKERDGNTGNLFVYFPFFFRIYSYN